MFSSITHKLSNVFKHLRGLGKISDKNIKDILDEIRISFLEADVNREAADAFIEKVKQEALGQKVADRILPEQQMVKIMYDALVELLGGEDESVAVYQKRPLRFVLAGLHGAGKTTTAGKLAVFLKKQGYRPLLVACDLYRPAAITQLEMIAEANQIDCYAEKDAKNAVKVAKAAKAFAEKEKYDAVIFDTAGRLQIDHDLVEEIKDLKKVVEPDEVLLVVDSALGQESVHVAQTFHEALSLTGIVLTKLDGDARGGAAVSMKFVTGVPIKFVGSGEKSEDFGCFFPKRMASRILGMGDVVSLVEKAQEAVDQQEQEKLAKKIKKAEFDLNDFLNSLQQIKKMGPLSGLMKMLPGMPALPEGAMDDSQLRRIEAIIQSMTLKERRKPSLINGTRKLRIAKGSGMNIRDVNALLKQFEAMQKMMKKFKGPKGIGNMKDLLSKFGLGF